MPKTISTSDWTVLDSNKLSPYGNVVLSVNHEEYHTCDESISYGASISGSVLVKNALTNGAQSISITVQFYNATNAKSVAYQYSVPVSSTDTATSYAIDKVFSTSYLPIVDTSSSNDIRISVDIRLKMGKGYVTQSSMYVNNIWTLSAYRYVNTGAPSNVSVSPSVVTSSQAVTVSWTAASNGVSQGGRTNHVTGYTVYYSDDGGATWNNFARVSSSTTSQVVAGPTTSGSVRRYFVRVESEYNNQIINSAIVTCSYSSAGLLPPENLKAYADYTFETVADSFTYGTSVWLSWSPAIKVGSYSGSISYYLQFSTDNFGTYSTINAGSNAYQSFPVNSSQYNDLSYGDIIKFRVRATCGSYSSMSNVISVEYKASYTCYSTNVYGGALFTNDSVAIGSMPDSDNRITTLSDYSYTANSNIQMQAQARINTTSLRMRKSPGFATSGTGWDNNVWKVGSATTYLNRPEQYICFGGSGGTATDDAKLLYVTSTASQQNINKMLFAYASDGNYIQGGNISFGSNCSKFQLNNGLTMIVIKLPFSVTSESAGGGVIEPDPLSGSYGEMMWDSIRESGYFKEKPIVFFSAQSTYDGFAPMPRLVKYTSSIFEIWVGSWQATDTTTVNRTTNCAGLMTIIAIGEWEE